MCKPLAVSFPSGTRIFYSAHVDCDGSIGCGRRRACASLHTELVKWPDVLVLHLKRRVVSFAPFRYHKIPTKVDYETVLPIAPGTTYHLRGVIVHHGDAERGHYTAHVRAGNGRWYFCDDNVSPIAVTTQIALAQEATMLLYER